MIWLALIAVLLLAGPVGATEYFAAPTGSGTICSSGSPCTIQTGLGKLTAGDTLTLQDGTYTGSSQMLNLASFVPFVSGSSGSRITVRAQNAGSAIIDGGGSLSTLHIYANSYWSFDGIDVGNSSDIAVWVDDAGGSSTGVQFTRMVAYEGAAGNNHVWLVFGCVSCTFEDIAGFGRGRNVLVEGGSRAGTVYRRVWLEWVGPDNFQGTNAPLQTCYACSGAATFENFIMRWNPRNVSLALDDYYPALANRNWSGAADKYLGFISYAVTSEVAPNATISYVYFHDIDPPGYTITDFFVDTRSQDVASGAFTVDTDAGGDRFTAIKGSSQSSSGTHSGVSNFNECTSLSVCPNFYTGDTPGTGARNCFRYSGGTLTSTKLWPWPMDDRIKAARSRQSATALTGTSGSGYAAATVTSEIVNRYGSVPTACLAGSSFTPAFPVASDFPSVSVRDDFNRANSGTLGAGWTSLLSDVFSIVSNAATAPSTGIAFGRSVYSDTKLQTSHEVYGTWTTLAATGTSTSFLSFAGTDLTENNQYRVRVNRTSSANTLVRVGRVDGAGNETTILSDVDLGIEAVDGNSFGVRVSGTTISVYWKWTDGIWYRVGQFTDSNLSSLPSTGVYGGIAGSSPSVIDNFGAGPFVDQPVQNPPSPPASVGVSRFGTTFPGRR